MKAFLDALPDEAVQVWEMPSDLQRGEPQYRQLDYFHGKPWLFGFLYAYGGTTMLHGDLADIVQRAQAAAADPQADQCRGLCIEPEAIHHNPLVFDLISRLAWNPSEVELGRVPGRLRGAPLRRCRQPRHGPLFPRTHGERL